MEVVWVGDWGAWVEAVLRQVVYAVASGVGAAVAAGVLAWMRG
jgi:uncharacterized protein (DUF697 family)